ncbi:MAG: c-type cytochrome [Thermoanaerobaculia bacterium]|nr:c-type cytochrome [Thermoanaerobaculia bacterium]
MFRLASLTLVVLFSFVEAPAVGQIPEEFTNLQLLDPAIEKSELVSIMRDWAGGLGVRCNHCHVGPENLRGMDFASDEKATKRSARQMLLMSRAINRELLKDLPIVVEEGRKRAQVVSCYTCHRGMNRPPRKTLNELSRVAFSDGPAAGVARYHELVALHEDSGKYDLRPENLVWLANAYLDGEDPADARKVLDSVLDMYSAEAAAYATLVRVELASGRLPEAEAALAKLVELDPSDESTAWVGGMVERARARTAENAAGAAPGLHEWSFLVGSWESTSKRFSSEGQVIEDNHGTATFSWDLDGQRLRERQTTTLAGQPMEVLNLFSAHPETGEWQIARTDSLHHTFNLMSGSASEGTLTFAEAHPNPNHSVTRRWIYSKSGDDAFSLRLEFSEDGGESWFVRNETEYLRR